MEFLKIAKKIHNVASYEVYLTFYYTFKGCNISENNLIDFCEAYNLDITAVNAV